MRKAKRGAPAFRHPQRRIAQVVKPPKTMTKPVAYESPKNRMLTPRGKPVRP